MKYEVGEVLSGERLPMYDDLAGDRRDGVFFRVFTDVGTVHMVPTLDQTLKVVAVAPKGSDYSTHYKCMEKVKKISLSTGFRAVEASEFVSFDTAFGAYRYRTCAGNIEESYSIFDAAWHWVLSNCSTPRNASDFSLLAAFFSSEWSQIAPAVLLSDWDHVDAINTREPWYQSIHPFQQHALNELARVAIWWGQLMMSVELSEPVATETELF